LCAFVLKHALEICEKKLLTLRKLSFLFKLKNYGPDEVR